MTVERDPATYKAGFDRLVDLMIVRDNQDLDLQRFESHNPGRRPGIRETRVILASLARGKYDGAVEMFAELTGRDQLALLDEIETAAAEKLQEIYANSN